MNRIIYKRISVSPEKYRSSESYQHPTNGGRFHIILNIDELSYAIFDEIANMNATFGRVKAPKKDNPITRAHKLKIKAKRVLISLGVKGFSLEKRKARK